MINAWEYALENYDGDNEYEVSKQIAESITEDIYGSCNIKDDSTMDKYEEELYHNLVEAITDVVCYNIDFGEIKREMESDAEEYHEYLKAREGRY